MYRELIIEAINGIKKVALQKLVVGLEEKEAKYVVDRVDKVNI